LQLASKRLAVLGRIGRHVDLLRLAVFCEEHGVQVAAEAVDSSVVVGYDARLQALHDQLLHNSGLRLYLHCWGSGRAGVALTCNCGCWCLVLWLCLLPCNEARGA